MLCSWSDEHISIAITQYCAYDTDVYVADVTLSSPEHLKTAFAGNGYTTTEYVELTKRLIESVSGRYAVDAGRIYGTGQSMGCMTTRILASEYPDLYAGCMFVDGQWDVSTLMPLAEQKFVYFAAEGDSSAYAGANELAAAFDAAGDSYAQRNGTRSGHRKRSARRRRLCLLRGRKRILFTG